MLFRSAVYSEHASWLLALAVCCPREGGGPSGLICHHRYSGRLTDALSLSGTRLKLANVSWFLALCHEALLFMEAMAVVVVIFVISELGYIGPSSAHWFCKHSHRQTQRPAWWSDQYH